jgi:hypothetical protein
MPARARVLAAIVFGSVACTVIVLSATLGLPGADPVGGPTGLAAPSTRIEEAPTSVTPTLNPAQPAVSRGAPADAVLRFLPPTPQATPTWGPSVHHRAVHEGWIVDTGQFPSHGWAGVNEWEKRDPESGRLLVRVYAGAVRDAESIFAGATPRQGALIVEDAATGFRMTTYWAPVANGPIGIVDSENGLLLLGRGLTFDLTTREFIYP